MGGRDAGRRGTIEGFKDTIHQRSRRCVHHVGVYTQAFLRFVAIGAFRVVDTSMQPALRPGDRLLAARWLRPLPGTLVVFRDPEATSAILVKRVLMVTQNGDLEVRGDNPNVSRDSRDFGPVPRSLVIGRAFYRYLPHTRRGVL